MRAPQAKTAFDPRDPVPPEDAKRLLSEVAKLLGTDPPNDLHAIEKAIASLVLTVEGAAAQTKVQRRGLTVSELRAIDAAGCTPAAFRAAKKALSLLPRKRFATGL